MIPPLVDNLLSEALSLVIRFKQRGENGLIDQAIALDREALDLCSPSHSKRPFALSWLASHLWHRYNQFGEISNLNEAIDLERDALALRPPGHTDRSSSLSNLALRLSTRFSQLGRIDDLDEAIILDREAIALRPPDHPYRSGSLISLSTRLYARYNRLDVVDDLNETILLSREALVRCPQGHPHHLTVLNNLAAYLVTRYIRLGCINDLDVAIDLARNALVLFPIGHPDRSTPLSNLAFHLATRYGQLGVIDDLNQAIALGRDSLALCPSDRPDHPVALFTLASHLSTRYNHLGLTNDLNEAIDLARNALALYSPAHSHWSTCLCNLAEYLRTRFIRRGGAEDREELFRLYAQLEHISEAVSSSNLAAAKEWIAVAEEYHHPTTLLAYKTALRLLVQHLTSLPSLPRHLSVLKAHTSSLATDAFSAYLRHQSPTIAVELLEQGRGVFWTQLARLRSPLEDVIASDPAGRVLADEFLRLASLIHEAIDSPDTNQHDRVCCLNSDLKKVVTNIRKLPGLSRFLLPSHFSNLRQAASGGPVIIVNASKYSCDALIIFVDKDPVHIPLSITKNEVENMSSKFRRLTSLAKITDMTRDLGIFLRLLWDQVVSPIVDVLLAIYPPQSRIWWCPTAEFTHFPLHAAGPYRKGQKNLSDLYIPSYTPTLTTLIHARRPSLPHSAQRKRFIAIGQATAAGTNELTFVGSEIANVQHLLEGLTTFACIQGPDACISRVADALGKHEWVHLACHGIPDPRQPFASAFALHDGLFTVGHIMRCHLANPECAYLSACHTTVGDGESPDEVIHLASAMQFSGFRSVIGTMWAVDDAETNKIASVFYRHMIDESGCLDHTRAAVALWKTMKSVDVSLDQRMLYIHIGA